MSIMDKQYPKNKELTSMREILAYVNAQVSVGDVKVEKKNSYK